MKINRTHLIAASLFAAAAFLTNGLYVWQTHAARVEPTVYTVSSFLHTAFLIALFLLLAYGTNAFRRINAIGCLSAGFYLLIAWYALCSQITDTDGQPEAMPWLKVKFWTHESGIQALPQFRLEFVALVLLFLIILGVSVAFLVRCKHRLQRVSFLLASVNLLITIGVPVRIVLELFGLTHRGYFIFHGY